MNTGTKTPIAQLLLVGVQLALALLAVGLDLAEACQACSTRGNLHLGIALLGAAGYAALLWYALSGRTALFSLGVFAAAGIHATLGAVLVQEGRACIPCILSFVGAAALAVLVVRPLNRSARYFLPVLGMSAALSFALYAFLSGPSRSEAGDSVRREPVALSPRSPESLGTTSLDVYEAVHCSYCRSFREEYVPLLESEYKGRLAIQFHEASSAAWVLRTPTFVLGGKLLFEGLPYRYQDLAAAVNTELAMQRR